MLFGYGCVCVFFVVVGCSLFADGVDGGCLFLVGVCRLLLKCAVDVACCVLAADDVVCCLALVFPLAGLLSLVLVVVVCLLVLFVVVVVCCLL